MKERMRNGFWIRRILIFYLLCLSFISYSQNFPVGINLNIQAPHSPAYHTFTNDNFLQTNKINLSLFLKDLVTPNVDVGLQWEFRGPSGIYLSDPNLISLPINIQQGISTLLSNNQLTPYLQSNNLPEVITNEDGFMAEGNWEVCVTAFELLNSEQVSATTCYYLFLEELDPPVIIMPVDSMMPMYPQNVQLAWQPLHLGNFLVEYEVNLWEVIPEMTTQQIIESTFPYYSTKVDQMTSSFLTMADPPLTVGQEYLMQVRVSDKVNGEGGLPVYQFKNYGYSDVVRFKYGMFLVGAECNTPSLPEYVLDDSLRSYILWDDGNPPIYQYEEDEPDQGGGGGSSSGGSGGALYHRMYYRSTEKEEEEWKHVDSEESWVQFTDYHRGQSYEIYVSNVCSSEERASESIVVDFPMLPPERDFSCGMPPLDIDLENRDPLPILMMGDTFMTGDFRVVVEEVSGGNGYYSGEGYFRTAFLKTVKVAVEFDDIFINSEYRMTEGFLETMYDPLDGIMYDIDEIMAGFEGNDEPFPVVHVGKLEDVKFENGVAILYPGGEEYEAPLRVITPEGEYLITGGEMLKKDEEFDPPNKIDEDFEVAFKAPVDMFYGYDAVDMSYPDHYEEVGGEKIPHKSVAYGGFDYLEMTIVKSKEVWQESDWDSISIRTHSQFEVKFEVEPGNKLKIKTPGLEEAEHIYVMYGKKCIGAFHLNSYMYTEFTVNLIPVNGVGSNLNIPELEKEVNKILGQGVAGVKLNLKTSQNIIDATTEIEADKYLMTAYSADMRRILNKHKDTYGQEDNELYLFLVNNLKDDVTGYMADGLNAGFIEVGGDVAHTLAHELGHGAFTLVHSWEEYDKDGEEKSDNLMDYSGKNRLRVKQWNRMHDQKLPRPWVRSSEAQQGRGDGNFSCITPEEVGKLNLGSVFYDPNGKAFELPEGGIPLAFYNLKEEELIGRLSQFISDNIVYHTYNFPTNPKTFAGYAPIGTPGDQFEAFPINYVDELAQSVQIDIADSSAVVYFQGKLSGPYQNISVVCPDGGQQVSGSVVVRDFTSKVSQKAIEEAIKKLNQTNEHTGVSIALYILDFESTEEERAEVETQIEQLEGNKYIVTLEFINETEYKPIGIYYGIDYSSRTFNEFLQESISDIKLATLFSLDLLTDLIDGLAYLVSELEIPERFYNPKAENYLPFFAEAYRIGSIMEPSAYYTRTFIATINQSGEFKSYQIDWAFHVGMWNGLVKQAEGLVQLPRFLIKLIANEDDIRGQISSSWEKFKKECAENEGTILGCGWDVIWEKIVKAHSPGNDCLLAAQVGKDVSELATFFVAFAKVGKGAQIAKFLETIDATTYIIKGCGVLLKFSIAAGKSTFRFGQASLYLLVEVTETGIITGFKILDETATQVLQEIRKGLDEFLPSPQLAVVTRDNTLYAGVDDIGDWNIQEIVNDAGERIQDSYGNYLAEIKKIGADGVEESKLIIAKALELEEFYRFLKEVEVNPKLSSDLSNLSKEAKKKFNADIKNEEFRKWLKEGGNVKAWDFLYDSPIIRKQVSSLENISEVLNVRFFENAGISEDVLKVGVNSSNSKAKLIERLREASDEGSSVEDFLDAFATKGKAIDHKMDTPSSQMSDAFNDLDLNSTNSDLDSKWINRQNALTKQEKIIASELLGEARVDQVYTNKGWTRLDVDGVPPGKQGKFDRIYESPEGEIHVIEAKGGGTVFGARTTNIGEVAQQGSKEYRDDIINNLRTKLGANHPLILKMDDAINNNELTYVFVNQKTNSKTNFLVKLFPNQL